MMFKRISETSDDNYSKMSVKFFGIKLFVQSLCENKMNQSKTSTNFVGHKLHFFNTYGTVALWHSKLF